MSGKTLVEVRDLAKQMAERRGHKIKRWNRQRAFRYTAICEKCRATLSAYSQMVDRPGEWESCRKNGMIVYRDREQYWTKLDYNWAQGTALTDYCYVDFQNTNRK
jgi:hypothetical protein